MLLVYLFLLELYLKYVRFEHLFTLEMSLFWFGVFLGFVFLSI